MVTLPLLRTILHPEVLDITHGMEHTMIHNLVLSQQSKYIRVSQLLTNSNMRHLPI